MARDREDAAPDKRAGDVNVEMVRLTESVKRSHLLVAELLKRLATFMRKVDDAVDGESEPREQIAPFANALRDLRAIEERTTAIAERLLEHLEV